MTTRKLVTIRVNGPIPELQGIAGPIQKPSRIPIDAIVKMVTNGKLVFEHDPENPERKVRLTLSNVRAVNFGPESTRVPEKMPAETPVAPTPVEPDPEPVDEVPSREVLGDEIPADEVLGDEIPGDEVLGDEIPAEADPVVPEKPTNVETDGGEPVKPDYTSAVFEVPAKTPVTPTPVTTEESDGSPEE